MADWTFEEFKAAQAIKAQFVAPILKNVRRCLVERIAAALEWVQYGDDGAQGRPVLPRFAGDYVSERGFVEQFSPVLMVVPAETVLTIQDIIPEQHQIDCRIDIHRDIKLGATGAEYADQITLDLITYIAAGTHVLLSMKSADFLQDWPLWSQRPPGVQWEVSEQVYDGLRKGDTALKRSGRIRLEVKTIEA